MSKIAYRQGHNGTGDQLSAIASSLITDKDFAFVTVVEQVYFYIYNADSTEEQSTPPDYTYIKPNDAGLMGVWVLVNVHLKEKIAYTTPESFGAVGDGVTDDSAAVQLAVNSGLSVNFLRTYSVDDIDLNVSGVKYYSDSGGSLIKHTDLSGVLFNINADNVHLDNLIFSGNEFHLDAGMVTAAEGVNGLHITNSIFKDIIGVDEGVQAALQLQGGASSAIITGCTFENLQSTNINQVAQTAYVFGIFINILSNGANNFIISNNKFNYIITNSIGGDINLSSADGIIAYSDSIRNIKLHISDNVFESVQKSAIKIQGLKGVKIDSNYIHGDLLEVPMFAAIRTHGGPSHLHITNTTFNGNISRGIHLDAENVIIDGLHYNPSGWSTDVSLITIASTNQPTVTSESFVIRNLSGNQIHKVIEMLDSVGLEQTIFCSDLLVEGVSITVNESASTDLDGVFKIMNAEGVILRNIKVRDSADVIETCFSVIDSNDVAFENIKASASRYIIEFSSTDSTITGNSIKLFNCDFTRTLLGNTLHVNFLSFSEEVSDIQINNCNLSLPTYTGTLNNQAIKCGADNVIINGLHLVTRDEGGGVANTSMAVFYDMSNFLLSNLTYEMQDANLQLDTNIFELNGDCLHGVISNVLSNSKGVSVEATVDDIRIENVSSADSAQLDISSGAGINSIRYTATGIEAFVNNTWTSLI